MIRSAKVSDMEAQKDCKDSLSDEKKDISGNSDLALKLEVKEKYTAGSQASGSRFQEVLAECCDETLSLNTLKHRELRQYTRISEKRAEMARIESHIWNMQQKEETLQKSLAGLQGMLHKEEKIARDQTERFNKLELRLKVKEGALKNMEEKLYDSETERYQLELNLRKFQVDHLNIKAEQYRNGADENLHAALQALEESIQKAEIALALSQERLARFAESISTEEKMLREFRLEYTEAAVHVSEAQQQALGMKVKVSLATANLKKLRSSIQRSQEERAALQEKIIQLGIDVAKIQSQKAILKAQQDYDRTVQLVLSGALPLPNSLAVHRATTKRQEPNLQSCLMASKTAALP